MGPLLQLLVAVLLTPSASANPMAAECLKGNKVETCHLIGMTYLRWNTEKDNEESRKYFLHACQIQKGHKCSEQEAYAATQKVIDTQYKRKLASVPKVDKRTCEQGRGAACLLPGMLAFEKGDKAKAKKLFERGCKLGDEDCCDMVKSVDDPNTKIQSMKIGS